MQLQLKKILTFFCFLSTISIYAQKNTISKYPSLMWEITGKHLAKPSYLFGTMHVSNKMVFHLSDSFYLAMRNCDVVSLELNPQTWQPEMYRMEQAQKNIRKYTVNNSSNYLNEKSFSIEDYEDKLKKALNEEPTQVNGLLYRSFVPQADFEENTYLDLYIYQTGRKLGKKAAGVEDFFETEKLVMEAYQDMAKEKKKKRIDTGDESYYEIEKKIKNAYRKGDLDLMDSLQKLTYTSDAFMEKFLYKRNEIQANSIDSIIKKQSLFVGVGAAHLPNERGVIELLRKKGYTLRPVKMADRDAIQKEKIDKLKVPVEMLETTTDDGFIQLNMPGKLYPRNESKFNKSWQYADMENGTYYMITRVQTHAPLLNQNEELVLKKVDSLLYENIPGKIIKKTAIVKNGYKGFDITNKTRRGDIQRYNILITPFEVLIFKISGNDEYVYGKEADIFFTSIKIKEQKNTWVNFQPTQGGFVVPMPQQPNIIFNTNTEDGNDTWEYEATDKTTGNAYSVWKKSIHNYQFLEEDTFDISLMEESLQRSEFIEKQVSRKLDTVNNYPALNMLYKLKNGNILQAKAIIKGPHYYLILATGKKVNADIEKFITGFTVTDFKYNNATQFTDTSYKFTVQTPIQPVLDTEVRNLVEQATNDMYNKDEVYNYLQKDRVAYFKNDTTGESILVTTQTFAKYFYAKDTAQFWQNQMRWDYLNKEFIVKNKEYVKLENDVSGYKYILLDTNSSRKITGLTLLKDNKLFKAITLADNIGKESSFITSFFNSFTPQTKKLGASIFENKLSLFFEDYYSNDSALNKKANSAIAHVYYGAEGLEKIKQAIAKLKLCDKDYFDIKTKFIYELGYIDDTCCTKKVVAYLKDLYSQTADTSTFQNPILTSLANLKTKEAYNLLKELLLQDPPVFEGDYGYNDIFNLMQDSLALTKNMFPEILQLAGLDDYKYPINELLRNLVDSGMLAATDYENYYSKLYFDAKIELKKQQNRDERVIEKENNKNGEDEVVISVYKPFRYKENNNKSIKDYSILLMPFYDKYLTVPKFFDKLLLSKDDAVKMSTAVLLIKNKKVVVDSIFENLAAKDELRSKLLFELEKINKLQYFPTKYKTQEAVARSLLLNDQDHEKFFAIELVGKKLVVLKEKKGYVYFFKYKLAKYDDWQMGISGLQPDNLEQVNTNIDLVKMTNKKLKMDEPIIEQYEKKLKQLIFSQRNSAANFFYDNDYRNSYKDY